MRRNVNVGRDGDRDIYINLLTHIEMFMAGFLWWTKQTGQLRISLQEWLNTFWDIILHTMPYYEKLKE